MSSSAKSTVLRIWTPVCAWVVVILVLSSEVFSAARTGGVVETILRVVFGPMAPERFEVIHHFVRKLAHVVEYAVLGMLNLRAFCLQYPRRPLAWSLVMALSLATACAGVDELNQALLATRTGSALDVLLDASAAMAGALSAAAWRARRSGEDVAP